MKFLIMQLSPPSPFNSLFYSGPSTTGQLKGLTCFEIIHSVYFNTIFLIQQMNPQYIQSSDIFCCYSTILRKLTAEEGYIQSLQI
jgi:hypothetical protein